jgi:hypothetical protein
MRLAVLFIILGIAVICIIGIGRAFTPRALEETRHAREMNQLREDQAARWQANQQPILDNVLLISGSLVLLGGAVGLVVAAVGFPAAGVVASYHAAQGVQFDRRFAMEQLRSDTQKYIAQQQHQHPLPPSTYSPSVTYAPAPRLSNHQENALPEPGEQQYVLPGALDLLSLNHKPSLGSILLGVEAGEKPVTVSSAQMVHVALAGSTGSGKTNTSRLLLAQLLACGVQCVVANPHYTSYDAAADEDWRPITARLHMQPARSVQDIGALFHWLVKEELERRLELRAQEKTPGMPIVLFLDELPVIANEVEDAVPMLSKLLRQGRALRLYVVGASQDFLVKTLGGGSGVRDCYRTAAYSGGDMVSATKLLDMSQKDIATVEGELGGGVVLLRSTATTPARLVRVPYVSNQALANLLPTTTIDQAAAPAVATPRQHAGNTPANGHTAEERRILDMFANGASIAEIARELSGAKNGRRYSEASERAQAVVRGGLARAVSGEQARAVGE